MKKKLCAFLAMVSAVSAPVLAAAQEGPLMVRVRAIQLDSANKDSTGLGLSINDKVIPEIDFSWFFTPQIAAELVLTYPQKHTLYSNGAEIGTLKHLPPTLTLQYHFTGLGEIKPYVGAGVNYTRFSDVEFSPAVQAALNPSVDKNSFGLAFQVGADFQVAKNTYVNLDVKKVQIRTDVMSNGAKVGEFRVDPWLIGLGLGWRF
jgi:outer membrane protein